MRITHTEEDKIKLLSIGRGTEVHRRLLSSNCTFKTTTTTIGMHNNNNYCGERGIFLLFFFWSEYDDDLETERIQRPHARDRLTYFIAKSPFGECGIIVLYADNLFPFLSTFSLTCEYYVKCLLPQH